MEVINWIESHPVLFLAILCLTTMINVIIAVIKVLIEIFYEHKRCGECKFRRVDGDDSIDSGD